MTRFSPFKSAVAAAGLAMVLAMAGGTAHAQPAPALSQAVLKTHQDDLEAMLADLAKVQTPDVAKGYEGYLAGQMPKYMANHKSLHHGAMQAFGAGKLKGKAPPEQAKLAAAVEKLDDTHFPKLAEEMARVEKLQPSLKKQFDLLRTLN